MCQIHSTYTSQSKYFAFGMFLILFSAGIMKKVMLFTNIYRNLIARFMCVTSNSKEIPFHEHLYISKLT